MEQFKFGWRNPVSEESFSRHEISSLFLGTEGGQSQVLLVGKNEKERPFWVRTVPRVFPRRFRWDTHDHTTLLGSVTIKLVSSSSFSLDVWGGGLGHI